MPKTTKMPMAVLLALTLGPAIAIGATLWFVAAAIPECSVNETERLPSPDGQFDLVIFSRDCGDTDPNTQAALVPPGEDVPFDAASFYSVGAAADPDPRWLSATAIEIITPPEATIYRDDPTVAGVSVTYKPAT
ncbi:hypothetical protein DevBK_02730 [Devosia sp. BK]|uniref:hypothetical protein n=1 Tax=Devosia sp. BK TaxID=2871706 RepID=UPI00293978F8|nr:hypothetical protein [Devosia sp. BK]MDV3250243.1 hypothetical protein [Devosia sp. BK]